MINFANLSAYHFVSELDIIEITAANDVTFTITDSNSDVVLSSTYTPVDGVVHVYHLSKLLQPLITEVVADFTFTAGSTSKSVHVVQSRERVQEPAMTFLPSFFLSEVMTERDTAIGRRECVSLLPLSTTTVTAVCTYWDGSALSTATKTVATNLAAGTVHTLDVSPSAMVDSSMGDLVAYEVVAGERTMRYRVTVLPNASVAMLAQNNFGCYEPIYLQGMTEFNTDFTRESALINGQLKHYNIEAVKTFKSFTGALRPAGVLLAQDLAASKDVYLLENNITGDAIVITAVDVKYTDEDSEVPDFSFTWRHASMMGASTTAVRPPELFDDTFDDTYN